MIVKTYLEKFSAAPLARLLELEFFRFLLAGTLNNALSYGFYLVLLLMTGYQLAYSLSYVAGILFSFYLNTLFTFSEKLSLKKFFWFTILYLLQYKVNLSLLCFLVKEYSVNKCLAPVIVVAVTFPFIFLLNRRIIKHL